MVEAKIVSLFSLLYLRKEQHFLPVNAAYGQLF